MSAFKKFLLFLSSFTLRFSMFFGLTILAGVLVLSDPNNIKKAIDNTDSYSKFSDSIVDSAKKSYDSNNPDALPINEPQIISGLKSALDTPTLKNASNTLIDSSYDWLEKKNTDIVFKLDFTKNKQVFAENTANYALQRLTSLSACTGPPNNLSLFGIECYPGGIDQANFKQQVIDLIMNDKTALKNNIITANDLPKVEGQKITQKYSKAPDYYSLFKIAPLILIGIGAISALAIVFLSRTKRIGIKSVGFSLAGTAVILAITPLLYIYVLPLVGVKLPGFGSGSGGASSLSGDITANLYSQFNVMLINIAMQVGVVAAVLLVVAKFMKSTSSAFLNLDKKSGLVSSEKKTKSSSQKNNFPVQTSEGSKASRKNISKYEKKYRKM